MNTKIKKVKEHLLKYGSITSWEAITKYHSTRVADIVYTLKQRGYDIRTEIVSETNDEGQKIRYAKYILVKGNGEDE